MDRQELFQLILKCNDPNIKESSIKLWKQLMKDEMQIHDNLLSSFQMNDNLWNIITEYLIQFPNYNSGEFRALFHWGSDVCSGCQKIPDMSCSVIELFMESGSMFHYCFICDKCFESHRVEHYRIYPITDMSDSFKKKCLELCVIDFEFLEIEF